jgi:sigma-B regulation protein RsbU (phosphoserine phosphatase)
MTTAPIFSANDLVRMLCGVLIVAAGVLSILLFLGRIKRKDYSLLYFGSGALLYGVRLFISGSAGYMHHHWDVADPVISLVIVIPFFLFFVETVTPRWKRFSKLVVSIFSAIALFGIADMAFVHNITLLHIIINGTALVAISVFLVMLFIPFRSAGHDQSILRAGLLVFMLFAIYTNLVSVRAISGNPDVEFIGFVFFLGCLGYVAISRTQRNEERLLAFHKEMEIARGIQVGLLPEKNFAVDGVTVASRYIPASLVAGDFYDFLAKDGGGLGVLIADVSGHGVPAALSASMVKVAISAQREWADDPAQVLTGLNSILYGNLQDQFVTAGYLFLHPRQGTLAYAGAGHPPLLVWRASEKKIESMEENGLILGIMPEGSYKSISSAMASGDRFILYTDGILEAPNTAGEEFGIERLKNFLTENFSLSAQQLCDALIQAISAWCGTNAGEQHDDLTLIVVDNQAA